MRCGITLFVLLSVLLLLCCGNRSVHSPDPVEEYLSTYREVGVSDSLLTELEQSMRHLSQTKEWMNQQIEIHRKIALEYRLSQLRKLADTGTESERAVAQAKIAELIAREQK